MNRLNPSPSLAYVRGDIERPERISLEAAGEYPVCKRLISAVEMREIARVAPKTKRSA